MQYNKVESKRDFYARWLKGEFGNRNQNWSSLEEFKQSGFTGEVVLRYKGKNGGTKLPMLGLAIPCRYASGLTATWIRLGADPIEINYSEAMPDDKILIQGEVMNSDEGLSLFYSEEKSKMRVAMVNGTQVYRLRAQMTLKQNLDAGSYDDIGILLRDYPESVIEFSSYSIKVGDRPNRNTIIWEVRNY